MKIKCWGSRGSIAVSGKEFIRYGGDTTCLEIRTKDNELIIVDAGTGIRNLGKTVARSGEKNISVIFTHAHWDHLSGFPFFKPLYDDGISLQLYGCPFAQNSVRDLLSKTMSAPYFPVNLDDLRAQICYHGACSGIFNIGSITITPILLNHPNQGIGYRFTENGKSFVFLTDNELSFRHYGGLPYHDYVKSCQGAELLIHDSEFTQEEYTLTQGWGHTVYTEALQLALEARVKQFGLFHHNQDRTDEGIDGIVSDCQERIAESKTAMKCFAVAAGTEITIN